MSLHDPLFPHAKAHNLPKHRSSLAAGTRFWWIYEAYAEGCCTPTKFIRSNVESLNIDLTRIAKAQQTFYI